MLFDQSGAQVGTHGLGPNWTSTVDGSVVNGAKVWQETSQPAGAIQWLLLRASSHTGSPGEPAAGSAATGRAAEDPA